MKITGSQVRLFIRLSRPSFLGLGLLLYGLGIGIGRYLGVRLDPTVYLLGQGLVTLIQLIGGYLYEFYNAESKTLYRRTAQNPDLSGVLQDEQLPRQVAQVAAAIALALGAALVYNLLATSSISVIAWIILVILLLSAFIYSLPPIQLATSGYGELLLSAAMGALLPAFAFSLQAGNLHRLIIMTATPLVALHFAMLMVFELRSYAVDLSVERRTLMVRLGWQTGMRLHDLAIVFAMGSVLAAYLAGMPSRIALNSLIALPLAVAQIWQMSRIRNGAPIRWKPLLYNAVALVALLAYLQLVGYVV